MYHGTLMNQKKKKILPVLFILSQFIKKINEIKKSISQQIFKIFSSEREVACKA